MRGHLLVVGALVGCGSPSSESLAPEPLVIAAPAIAVAVAPPPAPLALIAPDEADIVERPRLVDVHKNRWWRFGGTYWRMWGGALAGSQPKGVSVTPDGKVFVTNTGFHDEENVHRWDPATLEVIGKVDFPGNAVESKSSPDGRTLYVSNFYWKEMLALDTDDLSIERRFTVGSVPKDFAISPDGRTLYVSNWDSGTVSVVDVDSGAAVKTIAVGKQPRGTAVTRDGAKLYVTDFGSDEISVIDTATLEETATIDPRCRAPRSAAVTRDDRRVLITCHGGHELLVIDRATDTIERRIAVGRGPKSVDVSFDGHFAFTADYRSNGMSLIDLETWETLQVPLPVYKTSGVTVAHDDGRVYLTGWDSRNLIAIERLQPGVTPGAPSPRQPSGDCLSAECREARP